MNNMKCNSLKLLFDFHYLKNCQFLFKQAGFIMCSTEKINQNIINNVPTVSLLVVGNFCV